VEERNEKVVVCVFATISLSSREMKENERQAGKRRRRRSLKLTGASADAEDREILGREELNQSQGKKENCGERERERERERTKRGKTNSNMRTF